MRIRPSRRAVLPGANGGRARAGTTRQAAWHAVRGPLLPTVLLAGGRSSVQRGSAPACFGRIPQPSEAPRQMRCEEPLVQLLVSRQEAAVDAAEFGRAGTAARLCCGRRRDFMEAWPIGQDGLGSAV